jgi:hypothetical protein
MKWLVLGILLDVVAVAAIAVLIFVPLLAPQTAAVNGLLQSIVCDPGEAYEPRQIVTEDFDGTSYSLHAVCMSERGERDVTPQQTVLGLAAFLVPFLPGLGFTILGAHQLRAHYNRPRDVTAMVGGRQDGNQANPAAWRQGAVPLAGASGKTLTEMLSEIDQAYERRLIDRDEYEAARRRAIDEASS